MKDSVQDERISMRFWVRGHQRAVGDGGGRGVPPGRLERRGSGQGGARLLPSVRASCRRRWTSCRSTIGRRRSSTACKDVQTTLYIAFGLVVLVIFMFLGRATDTLIPAVALPLSLLLTFVAMNILGYSLDNLSLMALTLAIGFLVDDAIVFLENTVRLMETGQTALEATLQFGQGDQLHDSGDDDFAGRGVHSAGVHDRAGGAHLSGIFDHHHRFDFRQRHRFVDADAADVLAAAGPARRGRQEDLDGARDRRRRAAGAECVRAVAVVLPAAALDLGADLGGLPWLARSICLTSCPRLSCRWATARLSAACSSAQEGSSPDQMHAYQDRSKKALHANPAVDMTFTMSGNAGFLPANQGLVLAFLKDPDQRPPIGAVAGS